MNDGMGVYSCGLDGELQEGEMLFSAITLALWEVEVQLSRWILLFWMNLCLCVYLCVVHTSVWSLSLCLQFIFLLPSGCYFPNNFLSVIKSLCVYISPAVSSLWCLLFLTHLPLLLL